MTGSSSICGKPCWGVDVGLLLARLTLGAYFAIAGWKKVQKGWGAFANDNNYKEASEFLPTWFATPFGYALPFVELVAGVMLALGLAGRVAASLITLMLLSFIIATGYKLDPYPFHPNLIYTALAFLLLNTGSGRISLDATLLKGCCEKKAGA